MDNQRKAQIAEISASLDDWQRKSALIAVVLMFAGIVSMGVMIFAPSEDLPEAEASQIFENNTTKRLQSLNKPQAGQFRATFADSADDNI